VSISCHNRAERRKRNRVQRRKYAHRLKGRLIQVADIDLSSQLSLFRPLTKKKLGYTLRNAKLSYHMPVVERYSRTLWDLNDYGLHSLRSGEVASVVSNDLSQNVSERFLKRDGRCKNDEAKHMNVLKP